jgi:hypothetical protein
MADAFCYFVFRASLEQVQRAIVDLVHMLVPQYSEQGRNIKDIPQNSWVKMRNLRPRAQP